MPALPAEANTGQTSSPHQFEWNITSWVYSSYHTLSELYINITGIANVESRHSEAKHRYRETLKGYNGSQ
jgi:hypothetical protein